MRTSELISSTIYGQFYYTFTHQDIVYRYDVVRSYGKILMRATELPFGDLTDGTDPFTRKRACGKYCTEVKNCGMMTLMRLWLWSHMLHDLRGKTIGETRRKLFLKGMSLFAGSPLDTILYVCACKSSYYLDSLHSVMEISSRSSLQHQYDKLTLLWGFIERIMMMLHVKDILQMNEWMNEWTSMTLITFSELLLPKRVIACHTLQPLLHSDHPPLLLYEPLTLLRVTRNIDTNVQVSLTKQSQSLTYVMTQATATSSSPWIQSCGSQIEMQMRIEVHFHTQNVPKRFQINDLNMRPKAQAQALKMHHGHSEIGIQANLIWINSKL